MNLIGIVEYYNINSVLSCGKIKLLQSINSDCVSVVTICRRDKRIVSSIIEFIFIAGHATSETFCHKTERRFDDVVAIDDNELDFAKLFPSDDTGD